MIFYTYLWLREDGSPYYVGKGKGDRAFFSTGHGVHRPIEDSRIHVQKWLDEATAFAFEIYLIDFWGRKDLGTGILRNRTDGGDGPSGAVRSAETRRKLSSINKGKPSYKRTEETLRRQSEAQKAKPRPYCAGHRNYCTSEGIERMRASKIGSKASPATRAEMAKSAVTGWAKRRGELQLSL